MKAASPTFEKLICDHDLVKARALAPTDLYFFTDLGVNNIREQLACSAGQAISLRANSGFTSSPMSAHLHWTFDEHVIGDCDHKKLCFCLRSDELMFQLCFVDGRAVFDFAQAFYDAVLQRHSTHATVSLALGSKEHSLIPYEFMCAFGLSSVVPLVSLISSALDTELHTSVSPNEHVGTYVGQEFSFQAVIDSEYASIAPVLGWLRPLNDASFQALSATASNAAIGERAVKRSMQLPLDVQWSFGDVDVKTSVLQHLSDGDVILLKRDSHGWPLQLRSFNQSAETPLLGVAYIGSENFDQTFNVMADARHLETANATQWHQFSHEVERVKYPTNDHKHEAWLEQLKRLSVTLRVSFPALQLTLARAQTLTAGSVLTLNQPIKENEIFIHCGDLLIGTGRLVAVGEALGVQIASIATRDMGTDHTVDKTTPDPPVDDSASFRLMNEASCDSTTDNNDKNSDEFR